MTRSARQTDRQNQRAAHLGIGSDPSSTHPYDRARAVDSGGQHMQCLGERDPVVLCQGSLFLASYRDCHSRPCLSEPLVQRLWHAADLRRGRHDRRPVAVMLPLIVQNHPPGTRAHLRGIPVRCVADDAPSYSGVGASGKPGAVQYCMFWPNWKATGHCARKRCPLAGGDTGGPAKH